jgi:hypothetical protein
MTSCSNCAFVLASENDEYFCLSDNSCCSIPKGSVFKLDNKCQSWKAGASIEPTLPSIAEKETVIEDEPMTQAEAISKIKVKPQKKAASDEISFKAGGGWLLAAFAIGGDIMFILFIIFGLLRW